MPDAARDFAPDPVIEEYKKHVDLSLIRENLRRTPEQRIEAMIGMLDLVEQLQAAAAARRTQKQR